MKSSNKRVVSFIACLALVLTMCLYPLPASAAGGVGTVFSDGDADLVYFSGDTLTFSLTSIPGIMVDTPARVVFGIAGPMAFVPDGIITGLKSGGGLTNYADATILSAGGTFSAPVSGTIASGLTIGAVAVQVFVPTGGGLWTNIFDMGGPTDYLPLTYAGDPALVGIDTVLAGEGVTCDPALGSLSQSVEDLYNLSITFSKIIMPGVTGSISFTNLNLFESKDDLSGLGEGMRMNSTSPAISEDQAFVVGLNETTLSRLADDGATISVSSASFAGLTVDAFDADAVSGTGTISNLRISGNTVSFDVNHFSDYKMSMSMINQAKAIIGSSFTAVEGVDSNLITSLEAKSGMSATGVDITKVLSAGVLSGRVSLPHGELTYDSSTNGAVTLELNHNGVTSSAILNVALPAHDATNPVPGNSGTITSSGAASTSVILSWTAATDNVSPSPAIKYYVIRSSSNNITTAGALGNGTLLNSGGTAGITTYTVTGLSPSTTYYFNIGVRDRSGNSEAYKSISVTTTASGGGGGGGGGGTTTQTAPAPSTMTQGNTVTSTMTVSGSTDNATGKTVATVSADTFTPMLENVKKAETSGQQAVVEIKVNSSSQTKEVTVAIPKSSFNQVAKETQAQVSVASSLGTMTFDEEAVQAINGAASNDIQISMAKVDNAGLSSEVQALVGNAPVYDFTVQSGSGKISEFGGGSASVSVPYTLKDGDNPNSVVVYYINDAGALETVRGAYDPDTGTVTFITDHFSKYAIGYHEVAFDDVSENAWYKNAVDFIAAREITTGTDGNNFSPNAKLTRAQFLVMVMKAYGIEPAQAAGDNFTDAGNTYYTAYLAKAKELGLSNGDGNNLFRPKDNISRQDMFTLLYRTLDILGEVPEAGGGKALTDFNDADSVKAYAKTPMEVFTAAGVITGNNGMLTPQSTSTRAQMAQVLYNLLSK